LRHGVQVVLLLYYYYYHYYFRVKDRFPGESGSAGSCFSTCSGREPLWLVERFFTRRVSFLSPSHQYRSTEGSTKHWPWPVAWPHPFFIHSRTSDGKVVAVPWRRFSNSSTWKYQRNIVTVR